MSARRCNGCGASVRKPHEALCPVASKKAAKNFAAPVIRWEPTVLASPIVETREEVHAQVRALLSFHRPAGGDA